MNTKITECMGPRCEHNG